MTISSMTGFARVTAPGWGWEVRSVNGRGLVAGFEVVEDADYDDIRAMVADAEAAGVEWC